MFRLKALLDKQWLLLAVLSLGTASCGRSFDNSFEDYDSDYYSNYEKSKDYPQFWGDPVIFQCEDGKCHDGQALILSAEGYPGAISSCSSTLVSENIIVTNAHCLPSGAIDSCRGVEIFFPEIRNAAGDVIHKSVGVECKRVVAISPRKKASYELDFAVLELKESLPGRPMARISHAGVPERENLEFSASVASVYRSSYYARPAVRQCKSVMNTLLYPQYDHELSPIIAINECNPVKGNSGSSLLNDRGEIVALVQAGYSKSPENVFRNFVSVVSEYPLPATNLSCVNVLGSLSDVGLRNCEIANRLISEKTHGERLNHFMSKKTVDAGDRFDSKYFKWRWELLEDTDLKRHLLARVPKCFRRGIESSFPALATKQKVEFRRMDSYTVRFNSHIQYELSDRNHEMGLKLSFDAAVLKRDKKVDVELEYTKGGAEMKGLKFREKIAPCKS